MEKQYDVIIVGCGVAGCFAALQLPKEKASKLVEKLRRYEINFSHTNINIDFNKVYYNCRECWYYE